MNNYREHPFATRFPMMEEGGEQGKAAFEGLKTSIAREGIYQPIVLYEGMILDGRNRYKAAIEVGYKFKDTDFTEFKGTPAQAKSFVSTTNIHRRHLTMEQKKELVKTELKENPGLSNREIAELCGVTHPTVGKVRAELTKPPKDEQDYKAFCGEWEKLDGPLRERFAKEFIGQVLTFLGLGSMVENFTKGVSSQTS